MTSHTFLTKTGFRRAVEALITEEHTFMANPQTRSLMTWPNGMKMLREKGLIPTAQSMGGG
jgi:hypothetical protein